MIGLLLAARTALSQWSARRLMLLEAAVAAVAVWGAWNAGLAYAGLGQRAAVELAVTKAVATERESQGKARELALKEAHQEYSERARMGEQAAQDLRAELDARDRRISTLQRSVAHVPPLVSSAACPRPDDVRLSVGAVRLYDAAITTGTGGAGEQLPASACGAAADASGADAAGAGCEQPSAVTVGQLLSVAQANAETLGICLTRFSALRAYLTH